MNGPLTMQQRRDGILDTLWKEGRVRVTDLSERFGISEVTVRSDLADLEREGLLQRVHGGAIHPSTRYHNLSYLERKSENAAFKQQIAVAAARMIRDGDTIMLNSGTTTHFIASELKVFQNLHIVTNSVAIAVEIGHLPNINVILLGGNVNAGFSFTYGDDALRQLGRYKADKLILSVDGINHKHGISTYHFQETQIDRLMMERSNRTIVVADSTKIGRESFSLVGPAQNADYLITNAGEHSDELAAIADLGVVVQLAGQE